MLGIYDKGVIPLIVLIADVVKSRSHREVMEFCGVLYFTIRNMETPEAVTVSKWKGLPFL